MITRMTTTMMANTSMATVQRNFNRLAEATEHMSSGKRMKFASDDPASSVSSMRLRKELSATQQYKRNIDDANSWMQTADTAMESASSMYILAKKTMIHSVSSANGPASLKALGADLRQQAHSVMSQANATYLGRTVFAGNSDKGAAFKTSIDAKGDTVFFATEKDTVTSMSVNRRINADTTVPANMDGNQIFGTGTVRYLVAKNDGTTRLLVQRELEVTDPLDPAAKTKIPQIVEVDPANYTPQPGDSTDIDFAGLQDYQESVYKKIAALEADTAENPANKAANDANIAKYNADMVKVQGEFLPDDKPLNDRLQALGKAHVDLKKYQDKLSSALTDVEKKYYRDEIAKLETQITDHKTEIGKIRHDLLPDLMVDTSNNPSVMNLMVAAAQIMETGDLNGAKLSQISAIQNMMDSKAQILQESQATLGARHTQVLDARERVTADIQDVKTQISGVEDIDILAATIEMSLASMAYNSSLSSTQRVVQPSLLDYLR